MGDLLTGIDFKARSRRYTRNFHDSDCAVHNGPALPVGPCDCGLAAEQPTPSLSLDSPIEVLYETTLGYAPWPEQHYVAPDQDPA